MTPREEGPVGDNGSPAPCRPVSTASSVKSTASPKPVPPEITSEVTLVPASSLAGQKSYTTDQNLEVAMRLQPSPVDPVICSPLYRVGFNNDDGASLLMAFRGLQAESETQGQVHKDIAKDLRAQGYEERLSSSKAIAMNKWLRAYEDSQKETRRADEAEDDAKSAPNNDLGDHYTTSPRFLSRDKTTQPQRSATVSERIAQRFKEIQRKAAGTSNSGVESDAASPQLYESVAHDESDVVFGIDLRKWAEGGWNALTSGEERKDFLPTSSSEL
ncbi:hypothetical protein CY34DRAFT_16462 [Suillus luteus UH-Slu-Lm8-n1]|uniref:Uncharacterized protein n=1 Tax=Suillus luteus UH-Slu-Lm8-n1 TaxID=930992 RepID=A0A0D0APN8_9AGAM|nr:hypothetical protein CY34DRAFT_16462 [Suillus luteus UH-Slu-Lm8-n1]